MLNVRANHGPSVRRLAEPSGMCCWCAPSHLPRVVADLPPVPARAYEVVRNVVHCHDGHQNHAFTSKPTGIARALYTGLPRTCWPPCNLIDRPTNSAARPKWSG